jgi:hypothetical protein
VRRRISFEVDVPQQVRLTWLFAALERACKNEGALLDPNTLKFSRHLELVKEDDDEGNDAA